MKFLMRWTPSSRWSPPDGKEVIMHKKRLLLFLTLTVFLIIHCGIFEPDNEKGSISIQLVSKMDNSKFMKTQETLYTVHCTVKKGTSEIHDKDYSKNSSGSFNIEIDNLKPADNYSVLLYGKNSSGDIIGRAYKSSISVKAGDETSVSMSWNDMRPVLISPADGSTITDDTPYFDWSSVSVASYYELEVDNSSSFSSPAIDQDSLTSSDYTPSSSLSDDTYYWRVRAKDSQEKWGGWSDTWSFTIDINTVATPTFDPSPGTYATAQDVTISSSTSGATIHYTTNGTNPTDSDPVYSSPVHISSTTILKAKAYKSGWTASDVASGTYTIMEPPTLISPENGATTTDNTPTFDWSDVSGASNYELEVDNSSSFFSPVINQNSLTSSSYTATSSLSDDTCYWRVRAKDNQGNWGGWSDIWSFMIETSTITDIDGNVYQTVKIGNQWWMAENLKVTHYRNGDAIPNVISGSEWTNPTIGGAYCNYDNNSNNVATYGRLYNWDAVNDSRNIAPEGWHVPSDVEWQILIDYLGGDDVAGGKLKETGTTHWNNPNTGATNESGFSALPGGYRSSSYSDFYDMRYRAYFWCAYYSGSNWWYRYLNFDNTEVKYEYDYTTQEGYSVRCVKN